MTDYYVEEEYEGAFEEEAGFYYPDDEPHDDRRLRSREIEGRTTWMYLGFLLGLFLVLVLFSWACDGGTTTPTDLIQNEGESTDSPVGVATRLSVNVSRDIVTLSGSVPDEAAREQILAATRQHYGPENVIDELIVDDGTTMDGGTVSITGSAEVGDARPEAIQASLVGLGLDAGEFTVDRGSA